MIQRGGVLRSSGENKETIALQDDDLYEVGDVFRSSNGQPSS